MSRKKDSQSDTAESERGATLAGGATQPTAPQAGERFSSEPPSEPVDVFKLFDDAYREYTVAVQKSWSPEDARKGAEDAYRNYLQGLLETLPSDRAHKRVEVCNRYHQELRESWLPEVARQRLQESFRNYLRALQKAWDQLNVDEIDPHTLARISHSIFAGAGVAGNTVAKRQDVPG